MGKYVVFAIAALGLAACQSTAPNSAAAGGTAPVATATTGTHDVRVNFDNGVTRDVGTDYDLRRGDRVIMLSNGKVGPL
jgi:hypothetical protein